MISEKFTLDQAWEIGMEDGRKYFEAGIFSRHWEMPKSPYESGTAEYDQWQNGLSFGIDSAESSWNS